MRRRAPDDVMFAAKPRNAIPHAFVLDELERLGPRTNPMFGCLAVYVEEKIVMILRDGREPAEDNGVWIATTPEHHASLRAELPSLRSIGVLGGRITGWQNIPALDDEFEEQVFRACALVLAGDARIGKVPKPKRARAGMKEATVKETPAKRAQPTGKAAKEGAPAASNKGAPAASKKGAPAATKKAVRKAAPGAAKKGRAKP